MGGCGRCGRRPTGTLRAGAGSGGQAWGRGWGDPSRLLGACGGPQVARPTSLLHTSLASPTVLRHLTSAPTYPPLPLQVTSFTTNTDATTIPGDASSFLIGRHPKQQQQQHGGGGGGGAKARRREGEGATWAAARRENASRRDFTVNALLYDPFRWRWWWCCCWLLRSLPHLLLCCAGTITS